MTVNRFERFLGLALCYLLFDTSSAVTLNPVPLQPGATAVSSGNINAHASVIVNGKLIFLQNTSVGESSSIWSTDGSELGTARLSDDALVSFGSLVRAGDRVFFPTVEEGRRGVRLWMTNGTPEGTTAVSESSFPLLRLISSGSSVYAFSTQDLDFNPQQSLVAADRNELEVIDYSELTDGSIGGSPLSSICSITRSDFFIRSVANGVFGLVRYSGGQITPVDLMGLRLLEDAAVRQSGGLLTSCYYHVENDAGEKSLLRVSELLPERIIEVPGEADQSIRIDNFGPDVLVHRVDSSSRIQTGLFSISSEATAVPMPVAPADVQSGGSQFGLSRFVLSSNHIYLTYVNGAGSPPIPLSFILNRQFQDIFEDFFVDSISSRTRISTIGNRDLLFNSRDAQEFDFFEDNQIRRGLALTSIRNTELISDLQNPESGEAYVITRLIVDDVRSNANSNLFRIATIPTIQSDVSGLWATAGASSQGLSIHAGTTSNGERYLFASVLSYNDGEQYWLAGNTELVAGNVQVTIPLFEFDAPSFFDTEAESDPQSDAVGTLTLTRTGCNTMDALIELSNEIGTHFLPFQRIQDTSINNSCRDF